jgi:hypothetical protein
MSSGLALTAVDGGLALDSPYNPLFVAAFKAAVPYAARRWDGNARRWLVDAQYGDIVAQLVAQHYGVELDVPLVHPHAVQPQITTVRLEYLGRCKERNNGHRAASGYANGGWTVVIAETVLRTWFAAEESRAECAAQNVAPQTLYTVLAVPATADADRIKKAYRQLARQWHPDVCKEPDAREQFERIKSAYDILGDDLKRRKYDVGLKFEYSTKPKRESRLQQHLARLDLDGYRAPLRCGLLLVEGTRTLGVLHVTTILQWADIVDDQGRTMVSSWPGGAQHFITEWVTQ